MRLQKFLSESGIESRRKSENLIRSGKILVNGKPAVVGQTINPSQDQVTVNGKAVRRGKNHYYFLLHKPKGYLSTVSDPFKRRTVLELVQVAGRIYPVGRLDKDSEGLMLLTNDGELAHVLTHPKFQVQKTYEVLVQGVPSQFTLSKLRSGVSLEDGITSPCEVRISRFEGKKYSRLEIKIHEGRKREIRRMLKTVGHPVLSLRRTAMGPLHLSTLPAGEFRPLSSDEIKALEELKKNANSSKL